jgi:hypothetical protein
MATFKRCLQKLRYSVRDIRLVQYSAAVFCIAVVLGVVLNVKKSALTKEGKISCIKDHRITLSLGRLGEACDVISLPLVPMAPSKKIPFLEFFSNDEKWKATALYSESVGDLMAEISLGCRNDSTPLVAFVQDALGDEYFIILGKSGESSISSLQFLVEKALVSSRELEDQKYLGLKIPSTSEGEVVF